LINRYWGFRGPAVFIFSVYHKEEIALCSGSLRHRGSLQMMVVLAICFHCMAKHSGFQLLSDRSPVNSCFYKTMVRYNWRQGPAIEKH
jgi:hypothetical protein